ncbi:hypothetical protein E2C01_013741 [Portunus trituberculatus]|uniref:Uncharacterized protein n=1 Tax=Portunus trituberculatus TaxID=210409 RepID=A0A5B7DH18_PORTR|nr:hypothetical protein [Portunus trituberculatus]
MKEYSGIVSTRKKEAPMYERWNDASFGDLLFPAKVVKSHNKVCQMCDLAENELVEDVVLECEV